MSLLDANVLISAKNRHYGFDIAPGFWTWIADQHRAGALASITAVRDELFRQNDELQEWASALPPGFWVSEASPDVVALQKIADWAMNQAPGYRQNARTDFLASADYRLTALAASWPHTVVTHEVPAPESTRRIKLPEACAAHGVEWVDPFTAFRRLGLRLVTG